MQVLCVSCSNVVHKGPDSASTKVCALAADQLNARGESMHGETLRLADYALSNCTFCGGCRETGRCVQADGFNALFEKLCQCDGVLFVVPFYSVVPSKLVMVMEKLNQLFYTGWLRNPEEPFTLRGKKVAVIGHGGSVFHEVPTARQTYRNLLLKPIHYSLKSLGCDVVDLAAEATSTNDVFGVEGYREREDAVFPDMIHDWDAIEVVVSATLDHLLEACA